MEDQGDLADYLGVNISRKEGLLNLTQPHLIQSILDDPHLDEKSTASDIPALSTKILDKDPSGEPFDGHFNYRSVIGKLNYLEKST